MGRGRSFVRAVVLAALVGAGFVAPTVAQAGPTEAHGGQVVGECQEQTDSPLCRQLEQLTRNGAQACRFGGAPEEACSAIDGREYSEPAMAEFEASPVGRALRAQARLDDGVPIGESLLPATHNSYNSAAYHPTVSGLDHNQVASMTDQLRMGMRSLELDVHWFPSPHGDPDDGGFAPILCHGQSQAAGPTNVHIGCSAERHLREGLAEIRAWLDANPDDFVLLYLENVLDGDGDAHEAAAETVDAELGTLVYPTARGDCDPLPGAITQEEVLDSGAQVLLVGNAAPSADSRWCDLVHERFGGPYEWHESKSGVGDDFACPAGGFPGEFRRVYEDSTWLAATFEFSGQASPGEITAAETRAMVECGVNLFGFDQLLPADPRLEALVWSWAPGEPSRGGAAFHGADDRFRPDAPGHRRAVACRGSDGWHVTSDVHRWKDGGAACDAEFPGSDFSVPATSADNAALGTTKDAAGVDEVWLDCRKVGGNWVPNP